MGKNSLCRKDENSVIIDAGSRQVGDLIDENLLEKLTESKRLRNGQFMIFPL